MERKQKNTWTNPKGITLIALVITIVVLLILAGVSLNAVVGNNGIVNRAQEASKETDVAETREQILMGLVGIYAGAGDYTNDDVVTAVKNVVGDDKAIEVGQATVTTAKGNEVDISDLWVGVKVTFEDGSTTILTKDNYAQYLGKVVTNYKGPEGTEEIQVGDYTYTVSTTYRLYYIDFDNKYGDGAGTVYLKADETGTIYSLQTDGNEATSKIASLNPSLYANGVTAPSSENNNMKAVTWLTDTEKWSGLVTSGAETDIGDKVNYVVGAPSLEMMMDSYNAHYGLNEESMNTGTLDGSTRAKLFYKYNSGDYGYMVGPSNSSSATDGYYYSTSNYSVPSDSDIDRVYYPGAWYWLASPSAYSNFVMSVFFTYGGYVHTSGYNYANAFCPLVSLKSNVQLSLKDENVDLPYIEVEM